MSDDDEPSPFGRPGFIAATLFVVVLLGLGALVVVNGNGDDSSDAAAATPTARATPTRSRAAKDSSASACGLAGRKLSGTVSDAPRANWKYEGTIGYPTSPDFGPGDTGEQGVRTCFQHSPTGALFMAANAFAQAADPDVTRAWLRHAVARGPYRAQILADKGNGADSADGTDGAQGVRISLAGFRVLSYEGTTARIDLAMKASADGQQVTGSYVYELVWQDGDWKLSSDVALPLDFATIPDTAGYIPWGA